MKSALVRAVRTFVQAWVGAYLTIVVALEPTVSTLLSRTPLEAATVAGVIALLSFGQNAIEGRKAVHYDRG